MVVSWAKRYLKQKITPKLVGQLFRFGIVGGTSTLIDWLVFFLLTSSMFFSHLLGLAGITRIDNVARVCLVISFICGGVVNYLLHRRFTFASKTSRIRKQATIFLVFAIINLGLHLFLFSVFLRIVATPIILPRMIATALAAIVSFIIHKTITFNDDYYSK